MGNVSSCIARSRQLHATLSSSPELRAAGVVVLPFGDSYAFRVQLPFTSHFPMLSCSVPPDAIGNRGEEYEEGTPSTLETALYSASGVMYDEEVGYMDVLRFYSDAEVVKEILRVSRYIPGSGPPHHNEIVVS